MIQVNDYTVIISKLSLRIMMVGYIDIRGKRVYLLALSVHKLACTRTIIYYPLLGGCYVYSSTINRQPHARGCEGENNCGMV